jgi:hypothetical protein
MHRQPLRAFCWILAFAGGFLGCAFTAGAALADDQADLQQINRDYIKAFLGHDASFFQALLTDDFQAVLADGHLIDRANFLAEAALPPPVHGFEVHDVAVRVYDNCAVVSAWVSYKRPDETLARTRYFDLYVKLAGRWRMASIQWTRIAPVGH